MKSTEKNFIKRLKRHEEDALEYIVEQYLPLVKGITQKNSLSFKEQWSYR